MNFRILLVFLIVLNMMPQLSRGQYLCNLEAGRNDPLFSTYAAPLERSDYTIDQAYRMMWYDEDRNVEFISKDGGSMGVEFALDGKLRNRLQQFFAEPVVTTSCPDLVKFFFYPFEHLRVEVFFDVYASDQAFAEYKVINEGRHTAYLSVFPYLNLSGMDSLREANGMLISNFDKKRDGWMLEHDIPYTENLSSLWGMIPPPDSYGGYQDTLPEDAPVKRLLNGKLPESSTRLYFNKNMLIGPGEAMTFRVARTIAPRQDTDRELLGSAKQVLNQDPETLVQADRKLFSAIPKINFSSPEHEAIYWNSFNLIRQCMMPPEGECSYNYYIFSREPKWGWGYGGQVFHESLVMLAYAFMDGQSAMNSQRVYMERQWPSGYINYRTGPYLDEQIEFNGEYTSSAPWYNWQNLEIYKVTGDRQFLQEAYRSGKQFYDYYVSHRDSDHDGLCEWGGHAVLESVRDARVAVWDQVGWPSNFEGPDVNAMLVSEARSLSEMAGVLGKAMEAEKYKADAEQRTRLINEKMWDPVDGFYYNINKDDESFTFNNPNDLKRKEIIGFLPLWAGVADSARAARLLEHLLSEDEFWRTYGVPTLSAGDAYYNPIGYWNGPVWVQWEYLLFRGLLRYGYTRQAKELADRVLSNVGYHLSKDHVFWEFYSADDHQAGWNQTYIWAGIAARFLIDLNSIDAGQ